MSAEERGSPKVRPRRRSRGGTQQDRRDGDWGEAAHVNTEDLQAEAKNLAKGRKKVTRRDKSGAPKKRRPAEISSVIPVGDDAEEENPGMLLADFVNEIEPKALKPRGVAKRKKATRPSVAKVQAADDEGELAMEMNFSSDEDKAEDGSQQLLNAIRSLGDGVEDPKARGMARHAQEAQPESEFHAGGVGEEITMDDLLNPLAEAPTMGKVRKQIMQLAEQEVLPDAVSEIKKTREERKETYEKVSGEMKQKWIPQLQHMAKADQVVLGEEPIFGKTTKTLVGHFEATDDFEKELEEATRAAGTTAEEIKGAQALPMNTRVKDEKQRAEVARLKALMLREQQTKKRVNKIKSKTYRRIHRKADARHKEMMMERLEQENPEMAEKLKQEYEKSHAQMRLQRQRNARKKWAQTMQRFAKGDMAAQQEITKQAQTAHDEQQALRRAISGKKPDQSEDSEAVDLSESDSDDDKTKRGGHADQTLSRAKKLTIGEIKDLENEGELPTKGILGLGFMRDAIKKKREEARKEAKKVLNELGGLEGKLESQDGSEADDEDDKKTAEDAESKAIQTKGKTFTEEELAAARKQVEEMMENEDGGLECRVAAPITVPRVAAAKLHQQPTASSSKSSGSTAPPPVAQEDEDDDNPWLMQTEADNNPSDNVAGEVPAQGTQKADVSKKTRKAAEEGPAPKKKKRKKSEAEKALLEVAVEQTASAEEVLSILNADSEAAREQREIVRTAFVSGHQEEDFEEEVEAKDRAKEEAANKDDRLAGWGSWTGDGIRPKPPKKSKEPSKETSENKEKKPGVVINNNSGGATKYFIDKVPYPFRDPEQYAQHMKMPMGPDWNTLPQHLQKVKPKVFVKVGAIVPPLQYVKHLPEEQRKNALDVWASAKQPKRLKARI